MRVERIYFVNGAGWERGGDLANFLMPVGTEAMEHGDECVDVGAGIVEREGGANGGFLTEATRDGLGAVMAGPDGDAVGVEGGAHFFCTITIENKGEHAGFVGGSTDEVQTGNFFQE